MTLNDEVASLRTQVRAWHEEQPNPAVFWARMNAQLDSLAKAHPHDPALDEAISELLHFADVMGWAAPEETI